VKTLNRRSKEHNKINQNDLNIALSKQRAERETNCFLGIRYPLK
jgi:hypothetical protein